jgi:hypothetical protein
MYTIFDEEQHDYVKVEEPDHSSKSLTYSAPDQVILNFYEHPKTDSIHGRYQL